MAKARDKRRWGQVNIMSLMIAARAFALLPELEYMEMMVGMAEMLRGKNVCKARTTSRSLGGSFAPGTSRGKPIS